MKIVPRNTHEKKFRNHETYIRKSFGLTESQWRDPLEAHCDPTHEI